MNPNVLPIDDYIAECPSERQAYLQGLHAFLTRLLPEAEQRISWQMPTYKLKSNVIHFCNFKHHVGLFPGPDTVAAFAEELKAYGKTKASVHLDPKLALPEERIRGMVAYRLDHC